MSNWGTVRERADAILRFLREQDAAERDRVVPTTEIKASSGLTDAAVGGAMSDLLQRGLARRCGKRGWKVSRGGRS
jgi:DNA-binding IclR family transcriptional regulator